MHEQLLNAMKTHSQIPMVFLWFSHGFPMDCQWFPIFQWPQRAVWAVWVSEPQEPLSPGAEEPKA